MTDDNTKRVLEKLLEDHTGRHNAVTQSKLAEALGLNPSTLRSELRRLREERNIPIGNLRDGYFVIQSKDELHEYVGHINSEIESKRKTIEHTLEAWESNGDLAESDDADGGCEACGGPIDGDPWLWFSYELCQECHEAAPALSDEMDTFVAEGGA